MPFYGFHISSDYPCLNPNIAPKLKSKLTYPFLKRPFTGCTDYGSYTKEGIMLD